MADLIVDNATVNLQGLVDYTGANVIVRNQGTIYVPPYDPGIPGSGTIEIRANSISVDSTSSIFASYSGYRGGNNNGNPSNNGEGPGAGINGSFEGGGGGYGGVGGNLTSHPSSGPVYGTDNGADINMGSGGGTSYYLGTPPSIGIGGNGGGQIKLVANSITIGGTVESNGQLGANGNIGGQHGSGGGSGGGIWINGTNITISGSILAKGGTGGASCCLSNSQRWGGDGGGGGRIKIKSTGTLVTSGSIISAIGGGGGQGYVDQTLNNYGQAGANGTITYPGIQPTGQTLPLVYNISITPSSPVTGQLITITAQIANVGITGKVRAVFKAGDTVISDQHTDSLATFPAGGMWSPSQTYTVPPTATTIIVDAYGTADNGVTWVINDTESVTITPGIPTCTGVVLTPFSKSIDKKGSVSFTAGVTPTTYPYIIQFVLRDGTILGSVTSSSGWADFTWNTANNPPPGPTAPGTYYVKAVVQGQGCFSTESIIQISPPILQWTLDIYVQDINTNAPIQGANVAILTQNLTTDSSGHVQFIVNDGSCDITITATNYNPSTITEYVFNNKTETYYLAPITTANGNLRFISVPTGVDIYFAGFPTSQGTTDLTTGILIISGLDPSQPPISYTARKTGYNDLTGNSTIIGGTTVDVPLTLTQSTPTTGDVCIKSNPSGASITIDGNLQTGKFSTIGCSSNSTITGLTPGTNNHTYILKLTGYQDQTGNFSIIAGQTNTVDAGNLTPLSTTGSLSISSNPNGARIYIDSVDTHYITPATILNISEGDHIWRLILAEYKDMAENFHITAGQTTTVPTVTLIQKVGSLRFFSTPAGANISIGGTSKGTTTDTGLTVSDLPIGSADFVATLANYDTYNGNVTVVHDTVTDVTISLIPSVSGKGSLVIDSNPQGAEIFINGTDKLVKTPQILAAMDVGGYTYDLKLTGYYTKSGQFQISAGQTTTVIKTLQRPQISTAGFGSSAGIILIGGLAIGAIVVASQKKSYPTTPFREMKEVKETRKYKI